MSRYATQEVATRGNRDVTLPFLDNNTTWKYLPEIAVHEVSQMSVKMFC